MADKLVSSDEESTSDESFIGDVQETQHGLKGYQFEPRRPGIPISDASSSEESQGDKESDADSEPDCRHASGRLEVTGRCQCGRCSIDTLKRDKECVCCLEKGASRIHACRSETDETNCVTNSGDFRTVCLLPVVLRNVLVALNNVRGDRWAVNPPNNRGLRFASYRQFTWWVHGKLGPGRRRVIPACAIHAIREAFSKAEDEEYEGYHSGEDEDDQ